MSLSPTNSRLSEEQRFESTGLSKIGPDMSIGVRALPRGRVFLNFSNSFLTFYGEQSGIEPPALEQNSFSAAEI